MNIKFQKVEHLDQIKHKIPPTISVDKRCFLNYLKS